MVCSRDESLTHHTNQMKLFNAIAAAAVIGASFIGSSPVNAGLGEAEAGTKRTFDAYCGSKGNDCKVKFTDDRLTVNNSDGIDKGQIVKYQFSQDFRCGTGLLTRNSCSGRGTALVIYNENGVEGSGTFIFTNRRTFDEFSGALSAFCGGSCRPIGPSVRIEN